MDGLSFTHEIPSRCLLLSSKWHSNLFDLGTGLNQSLNRLFYPQPIYAPLPSTKFIPINHIGIRSRIVPKQKRPPQRGNQLWGTFFFVFLFWRGRGFVSRFYMGWEEWCFWKDKFFRGNHRFDRPFLGHLVRARSEFRWCYWSAL